MDIPSFRTLILLQHQRERWWICTDGGENTELSILKIFNVRILVGKLELLTGTMTLKVGGWKILSELTRFEYVSVFVLVDALSILSFTINLYPHILTWYCRPCCAPETIFVFVLPSCRLCSDMEVHTFVISMPNNARVMILLFSAAESHAYF